MQSNIFFSWGLTNGVLEMTAETTEQKVDAIIERSERIDKQIVENEKEQKIDKKFALYSIIIIAILFGFVVGGMVGYACGYEHAMNTIAQKIVFHSIGIKI